MKGNYLDPDISSRFLERQPLNYYIRCLEQNSQLHTEKRMLCYRLTAFNSTDIRSVQDNVATPVTTMMVTVCISTDGLSSVLISPDLSDNNSFHQCCLSIMPVTACSYRLQQSVPNTGADPE